MIRSLKLVSLAAVSLFAAGAAKPTTNWNTAVAVTPAGSHIVGNPDAQIKLAEFVSYTCSHCAHFEIEADGPMRLTYLREGKLSIEVRHMLRDPIDLTVAMLTNCGTKDKFFINHSMFIRSHDKWMKVLTASTPAQRSRWQSGDLSTRSRAIASDFRFYDMMATRGYDRTTLDRCLSDTAMAQKLAAQTQQASELGVTGTPSFALNGVLLENTHSWTALRPQIEAAR